MPVLSYKATRPVPYNGAGASWPPGEARTVSDADAQWLLGLTGADGPWFERVGTDPVPADVDAPVVAAARNAAAKGWKKK